MIQVISSLETKVDGRIRVLVCVRVLWGIEDLLVLNVGSELSRPGWSATA